MVPDCVKSTQSSIEISWRVKSHRNYSYKVEGGDKTFGECNSKIRKTVMKTYYIIIIYHCTSKIYPVAQSISYLEGMKSGSMDSDDFKIEGDRGTLTITSSKEWTVALYKVTVRDITYSVPTVKTKNFTIKKGL